MSHFFMRIQTPMHGAALPHLRIRRSRQESSPTLLVSVINDPWLCTMSHPS
jgi:hypothetical protein